MPRFGPVRRDDLIHYLRRLGFDGPWSGGKHAFMSQGDVSVRIPNPHRGDIGKELLARILRQAGVSVERWEHMMAPYRFESWHPPGHFSLNFPLSGGNFDL
ncbi:MAG: type II toxin-antitoxin system HicA family toxin [Magnetococcales bacterium]|nr:type II toxin-antitoxin system HicA family toxin [Magnetococcales bacterium]